jgi:predicted RNA-binding protein with PIN domain
MPYLIDGHNLIPKLGLRLDAIDDELQLIEALQHFCRASRRAAEAYFDGAPVGQSQTKKFGQVTAHFVSRTSTADEAIKRRLVQLGRSARNWTVVSSDGEVRQAALAAHAQSETSEEFAKRVGHAIRSGHAKSRQNPLGEPREMTDLELEQWMEIFRKG